jgi:hypothetical protein
VIEVATRGKLKSADVEAACKDLEARTLAHIPGDFARLVYLASTRDYNSGEYYHEGLARQFTENVARMALASCHNDVFERLVLCSVKELVNQLEIYVRSTRLPLSDIIHTWARLQPYRVTIPLECGSLTARFFASNVMAALAILQSRESRHSLDLQSASPRQ